MSVFLENAQKIFDVARTDPSGENSDFALLFREDGGIHMLMESPLSIDAATAHTGARTGYHVVRSNGTVKVSGLNAGQSVLLEQRSPGAYSKSLLRDQPLYRITSPLLISASA